MEWIKRVLALEPTVVQAVVRALFVFAGTVGLGVSDTVQGQVLVAIAAFYALVEIVTTTINRARVTPTVNVVEKAEGQAVVAGPANDLVPEGAVIRYAGGGPDSGV